MPLFSQCRFGPSIVPFRRQGVQDHHRHACMRDQFGRVRSGEHAKYQSRTSYYQEPGSWGRLCRWTMSRLIKFLRSLYRPMLYAHRSKKVFKSNNFFSLTSCRAEIWYFSSANRELSINVLVAVVCRRKVALHTSSHLTPTEPWRNAFPPFGRVVEFRARYRQIPGRRFFGGRQNLETVRPTVLEL